MKVLFTLLTAILFPPFLLYAQESKSTSIEKWPEKEFQMAVEGCALPLTKSNVEAYKARGRQAGVSNIDEKEIALITELIKEQTSEFCECLFEHTAKKIPYEEFLKIMQQNPQAFMEIINVSKLGGPGGDCELKSEDMKRKVMEIKKKLGKPN